MEIERQISTIELTFGEALWVLRRRARLYRRDVAQAAKIGEATLAAWESDQVASPGTPELWRVTNVLSSVLHRDAGATMLQLTALAGQDLETRARIRGIVAEANTFAAGAMEDCGGT